MFQLIAVWSQPYLKWTTANVIVHELSKQQLGRYICFHIPEKMLADIQVVPGRLILSVLFRFMHILSLN